MRDKRHDLFRSTPPGRKLEPGNLPRVASAAVDSTLGYFRLVPPGRRASGSQFRPPNSFIRLPWATHQPTSKLCPIAALSRWEGVAVVPQKHNNGLRTKILRPLPVNCWDWTGGLRAFASARAMVENPPPGLTWGLGRKASGLSHLTYETTGTFIFQAGSTSFPV